MREMIGQMKDCSIAEPVVTIRSRMKEADMQQLSLLADSLLGDSEN